MEQVRFLTCVLFLSVNLAIACGQGAYNLNAEFFSYKHPMVSPEHNKTEISLGQYRGKVIILDFWNRYCSSCIAQMPKLYGLQQKYGDRLQIIPVTADRPEQVTMIYERQKGGDFEIKLATIHSDTILTQRFGVTGYPTAVWLDSAGNFLATTYGSSVSEETVSEVLEGDYSLLTRVARVTGKHLNVGRDKSQGVKSPRYETGLINITVEPYDPTASTKLTLGSTDTTLFRFGYTNTAIQELLKLLLLDRTDPFTVELLKDYFNRRIVMDDRLNVRYPYWFVNRDTLSFGERVIMDENSRYSLQIESPRKISFSQARRLGLDALQVALDIQIRRTEVEKDVLIIRLDGKVNRQIPEEVPHLARVYLRTVSDLLAYINNNFIQRPLAIPDEDTSYDSEIGITLDKRLDYNHTVKTLKKHGVELLPERQKIEMLHIGL